MDVNVFPMDEFSDIFPESAMKIDDVEEDIHRFMSLLGPHNTKEIRYENICNVVYKFLHKTLLVDLEEKIFKHVMPAINDLFITIFKEISDILIASENQDNSATTLKLLRDCLLMCLGLFEVLDCILTNLLKNGKIDFCYVQSVPAELATALLSTFQHCKESEKIYDHYFSELKEIVQLFRSAQDIHTKLLQLLVSHINFNFDVEQQIILLKGVLVTLEEIGEVVVEMNVKTLADNWKGYMTLIDKNSDILIQNNYDIKKSLDFITLLIEQNLKNVLEMSDQKSYYHILKMSNFFVKIFVKLCDIFWQQNYKMNSCVLLFLSSIYRFYTPYLQFKGYCNSIANGIEVVINVCDPLIEKCLLEAEFVMTFCKIDLNSNLNSPGLLFFILKVFSKLTMNTNDLGLIRIDILIDIFFKIIGESYSELFWSVHAAPKLSKRHSLFDESCYNVAKVILLLEDEQFSNIEFILMKNVLQPNIWSALAALEIWLSILRFKGSELTYSTLVNIVTITNPVLQNIFAERPEKVFIEHLLHELYTSLPEAYRIQLIDKYSIATHLHLWRIFTFNEFPVTCIALIESLLISTIEKIEDFQNGKCNSTNLYFLCNCFDAIANSSSWPQIDKKYLIISILKLWDFDVALCPIQNNNLVNYFIKKMFNVTNHLISNLTGQQILTVILKVRELSYPSFQIEILQMLKQLSHMSLDQFPEKNQIAALLLSIFTTIYTEPNPFVKQLFLETCVYFFINAPDDRIFQNVFKRNQGLFNEVSNFIQQTIITERGTRPLSGSEYFAKQKLYKFQHKCPELARTGKRTNSDSEEVKELVKRVKSDLELLYSLSDKKFVDNSVANIISNFK